MARHIVDSRGRFLKGQRYSPRTEFKKGQHWRDKKPFWNRSWLENEYTVNGRSCEEIAAEFGVGPTAIQFWLKKHGITSRNATDAARVAYKAGRRVPLSGELNPMFGKRGHGWKGGVTPLRQAVYATIAWKRCMRLVRERDKCCRLCSSITRLEFHHIEPFGGAPLLACDPNNVIWLCRKCHMKTRGCERRWRRKLHGILSEELICH